MLPINSNISYTNLDENRERLPLVKGGNKRYREYLEKNALSIMSYNTQSYMNSIDYKRTSNILPEQTITEPFLVSSLYDTSIPPFGNNPSDLKETYLANLRLQARKVHPEFVISP